jgi:hypothetical protein
MMLAFAQLGERLKRVLLSTEIIFFSLKGNQGNESGWEAWEAMKSSELGGLEGESITSRLRYTPSSPFMSMDSLVLNGTIRLR